MWLAARLRPPGRGDRAQPPAASCASPPAATRRSARASAGASTATSRCCGAEIEDGRFLSPDYPDALARIWSALRCHTAGDVLLSAAPGYEFVDWGGADHVGGGSPRLACTAPTRSGRYCGAAPAPGSRAAREQWSLRDITPMIRDTFRVGLAAESAD